jgi:Carboxypeptidase regulatory-like domain
MGFFFKAAAFCTAVLLASAAGASEVPHAYPIQVDVYDSAHAACAGATVNVVRDGKLVQSAQTDAAGRASLTVTETGHYNLDVSLNGFQPVQASVDVPANGNATASVAFTSAAVHHESVDVEGTVSPIEEGSSTPATFPPDAVKQLPSHPATVADALPLIPGVIRSPEGSLKISGSGEHRSALLVNSADVTDPATGTFGLTVPIDSVQSVNVYQTAYLAEYGRFTAGLVSVETRRGGEKWKWDLNDPLPDFRIRSRRLEGIKDATPRLNFEGPLIAGKLYFSEGIEYVVRNTEAYTLTYPNNQSRQEGFNSFSQFDWVVSDRQLLTATLQAAPQREKYVNINFLNPEPASPNDGTHNYVVTIGDRFTIGGGLLDTTLSGTRFDASVWPQGPLDLAIAPWGNSGNYFDQQTRTASRMALSSTYAMKPIKHFGTHDFKVGSYLAGSSDTGQVTSHPVDILNGAGLLSERITFAGGRPYGVADTEFALFGQDHWTITPKLALDMGMRMESQEISESVRLAPRFGFAWSPFTSTGTVIRGGFGLFYDRVPLNVYAFSDYPSQVQTFFDANGGIVSGPITYQNVIGEVPLQTPFVFRGEKPGNFSPRSSTWSVQLEQPIGPSVKLRASYMQNDSSGLVLLNPVLPAVGSSTGFDTLSGTGSSRYRQFEVTARVRVPGPNPLYVSYVRSRAEGDLNEFAGYLGSFPNPILRSDQYSNLSSDLPNRFLAWGNVKLPHGFWISPVVEYRNGFPYAVTDAMQQYVGVPYQQRFPHFFSADSRFSKDLKVSAKYAVRLSLSLFNMTDHFNPEGLHTNIADPAFGSYLGQRGRRYTVDFDVLF